MKLSLKKRGVWKLLEDDKNEEYSISIASTHGDCYRDGLYAVGFKIYKSGKCIHAWLTGILKNTEHDKNILDLCDTVNTPSPPKNEITLPATAMKTIAAERAERKLVETFFTNYKPGFLSFWRGKSSDKVTLTEIIEHAQGKNNTRCCFFRYSGDNTYSTFAKLHEFKGVDLRSTENKEKTSAQLVDAIIKKHST